ncbi:MAG: hypothetical protein HFH27_09040, partial [Clostridiaceae bacterium]|nr:hypothetical protein [Clostridiaceae bacterium]
MKKKQLVCSTLAAAMLMSSAVPGAGAARFSDVGGHWGESSINRWGSTGVIVGTDGRINPNGSITRGEMASIIAEMLGLEEMAPNVYPDLNGGWYSDAMLKCAAAGIMTGDDYGRMRPYDNITGAEIAVIFNKALNLSASVSTRPTSATGYVKPWAQGYVDQLALRGIAVGNDGGTFQPMNDTSRAAVISMFDRAVDTYITSPGTYQARGITVVNTPGTVTLTGAPGSIDITQRASGGRVYLDHTTVGGTIKIHGGRTTLTAQHASLNGDVQVVGYANTVNIDGTTSAGVIQLGSDAGTSRVSIGSSARAGSIISDAASSEISVSGTVNNIQLSTNAVSARVDVRTGAKVENVTSNANSVIVSGSGTLRRADIYGAGNRVTTPHTTVSTDRYARSYTVRKNSTPSRYYYGTSDRHLVRFYFDDDMDDLVDSVRVRDGEKVDKSDIKTPRRNGYRFDGWEYGDYYGRYYDSRYDRYYDWYYDDYYYDIDDWYRSRDYEWDSHERAYYNSYAKVYYDDYKDKYFVLDGHDRRDYLTLSELRDRYRRYYRDDYYDDWRYDHYYDHYYGESFSFSDRIYSSVNLYATWVRDKDYDYDDDTVYTASQASTKLKNELGSLHNVAVSGTNVIVTGSGDDGSVTTSDIESIARELLYVGQHLESGTTLYVNSHAVGSATTRSDIVNWINGARAELSVVAAAPSVPADTTVLIQDGSGNPPTYKITYKAGAVTPEEKPDPTPDVKTPEENAIAAFEEALGSDDPAPATVKAAIEAAAAVKGVTVIVKLNGQESSAAAIGELNPAESEVDFEVTVVIGKTTKTCTIKGTKKDGSTEGGSGAGPTGPTTPDSGENAGQPGGENGGQTDGESGGQTDGESGGQTDGESGGQTDGESG